MDRSVTPPRLARLSLLLLLTLPFAAREATALTPKDRRFVSAKQGIGVEAPTGWTLSTHTGYPNVLVLLLHPDGSRISVAVSDTPAKNARELVELNRKGLEAQKLKVLAIGAGTRGSVEVTAQASARAESLVQLYLVRSLKADLRQAVVVTLIARSELIPTHRPALEAVMTTLSLDPIESAPGAGGATPDGGVAKPRSARERPAEQQRR